MISPIFRILLGIFAVVVSEEIHSTTPKGHGGGGHSAHGTGTTGTGSRPHVRRCGGKTHSSHRVCSRNDTMCGEWHGRFWHPIGCRYEDMSPAKAARCLGNRTLAFIGDSQIRDLAIGVTYFLLGVFTLDTAPENKFDGHHEPTDHGTRIEDFSFWMRNIPPHNHNGYVFPRADIALARNISWLATNVAV